MSSQLSTAEWQTLEAIADADQTSALSRLHLEKLFRLDLIEPAGCSVMLTLRGKETLFNQKK